MAQQYLTNYFDLNDNGRGPFTTMLEDALNDELVKQVRDFVGEEEDLDFGLDLNRRDQETMSVFRLALINRLVQIAQESFVGALEFIFGDDVKFPEIPDTDTEFL